MPVAVPLAKIPVVHVAPMRSWTPGVVFEIVMGVACCVSVALGAKIFGMHTNSWGFVKQRPTDKIRLNIGANLAHHLTWANRIDDPHHVLH